LKVSFEALRLRQGDKENYGVAATLTNIGLVYYKMRNYRKALSYYRESEEIKLRINDTYSFDRLLVNMGLCHVWLKEFPTAIKLFDRANLLSNNNQNIRMELKYGMAMCNYF
jgi:tetratricopeptide (TPR) repeat protein